MKSEKKGLNGFSRAFWTANSVELLERAAYYGVFIVITLYLSRIIGFSDIEAGIISGLFSGGLYFLPPFSGAFADKIGFKKALMLAFLLLTIGYFGLAIFPTFLEGKGLVEYGKEVVYNGLRDSSLRFYLLSILLVIMVGGSFIKSVITGTIAKETSENNRARGFSIFYMMVNIGAFSGKTIVKPLRESMGNLGLINLNYFSAAMTLFALIIIFLIFKSSKEQEESKSFKEIWISLVKVFSNIRLMVLIIIITGFWLVQHQLYATMPKYVLRMAGEGSSPSWYANVNPLVVVLTVAWITQLMRKRTSLFSMTVGMFIMPISALAMASGNLFNGNIDLGFMQMHPIALMMIVGIIFQAIAEAFISPRFLEFFSLQAPKGEEGLYLGFSHLHSFFASIFGFGISGFLLEKYCPDPSLFETRAEWELASVNAHYIWYFFAIVAVVSALLLIAYGKFLNVRDAKKSIVT